MNLAALQGVAAGGGPATVATGIVVIAIAAKAGVSKPVVYEHFGGKEGLYAVVVDREMSALLDGITYGLLRGGVAVR